MFRYFALVVSLFLLAQQCNAFWRLPCPSRLTIERLDPIVNAGAVSGHVHTISGASAMSTNTTFAKMRASNCTSCMVKQDMSAYWTPAIYFQWANGSFSLVDQLGGGLIYYLPRNHKKDKSEVLAFPDGFRMLTGSPFLRTYNKSSRASDAIGFSCLNSKNVPKHHYLPLSNCDQGLRGEIRFPSCWDGVNVDSLDHSSHMAYSDGESGPCPASHPKRLVTLFFEMMWDVNAWSHLWSKAKNPKQPFVIAMGDPTGYGYHGDFLNGWDHDVLQKAIRTCTSDSGRVEDCPVFDLKPNNAICKKTPDVDEIVTGTLNSLPGCNPVKWGPNSAAPCKAPTTPAILVPTTAYTTKVAPPGAKILANEPRIIQKVDGWTYKDCYSDDGSTRALSKTLKAAHKTVESCLAACAAGNFALCG